MALEVGTTAPDFTLRNQFGQKVSLSDFRGKKVVVANNEEDILRLVADRLTFYGWRCTRRRMGRSAWNGSSGNGPTWCCWISACRS